MSKQGACAYGKQITATKTCTALSAPAPITIKCQIDVGPDPAGMAVFTPDVKSFQVGDWVLWSVSIGTGGGGHSGGGLFPTPDGWAYRLYRCATAVNYGDGRPLNYGPHVSFTDGNWQDVWESGSLDPTFPLWVYFWLGSPSNGAAGNAGWANAGAVPRLGEGFLNFTATTTRAGFKDDGTDPYVTAANANGSFTVEWEGTHYAWPKLVTNDVTGLGADPRTVSPYTQPSALFGIYPEIPRMTSRNVLANILSWTASGTSIDIVFWIDKDRRVTQHLEWGDFYSISDTLGEARAMLNTVDFNTLAWNTGAELSYDHDGNLQKSIVTLLRNQVLPSPPFPLATGKSVPILNAHVNAFGSWQPQNSGYKLSKAQIHLCGPYADQLYRLRHGSPRPVAAYTCDSTKRSDLPEVLNLDVPAIDDSFFAFRGLIPAVFANGGDLQAYCMITPPF